MNSKVQNLCKLSQSIFSNSLNFKNGLGSFSPGALQHSNNLDLNHPKIIELKEIFSKLTLKDIYFDLQELIPPHNQESLTLAPVTYTSIFVNQFFSLTCFGFRSLRSNIPLHDHPGMYGFVKCVYGKLSIKSYTILDENIEIPMQLKKRISNKLIYDDYTLVPSIYLGEEIISENPNFEEVGQLTPTEKNLHEIRPLTECAVMADIISPPYQETTDSFYYYIIGTANDSTIGKQITWLLKSRKNYEYYCDTLTYQGPDVFL